MFDRATYPWVAKWHDNLSPDKLLVLLNDFCDNALATYAMKLTRARAQSWKSDRV